MPVKLADIAARMKAVDPELDDARALRLAHEAVKAMGWDATTIGDVYNPAEGCYPMQRARVVPRDDRNVRVIGNGRGKRYR